MFGVLVVAFGGDRITGALRVTGELEILLGDVGGVASDLHLWSVGLVHARQWILVVMMMVAATAAFTAVTTPHALILTVSHVLQFRQPLFAFVELKLLTERHPPIARTPPDAIPASAMVVQYPRHYEILLAAALTTSLAAVLHTPRRRRHCVFAKYAPARSNSRLLLL
jgi:hypothetical protein